VNAAGDWRYVYASTTGVAHYASAADCQDASAARLCTLPAADPALLLGVADGAGSADAARAGAELACRTLLAEGAIWLARAKDEDWTRAAAEQLLMSVQTALTQAAADDQRPARDFACTLLGAIITADRALLLQIGDGAIVIGDGTDYQPVFWPQAGEYANETYFVTDPTASVRMAVVVLTEPVAEIALFSDGLQPLALHYQSRRAHAPFFRPLFARLRAAEPGCSAELTSALARFLDSAPVNQRTHDDKTLILASRLSSPVGAATVIEAIPPEDCDDEAV
jgi:Protein phosphatase 2C